MQKVASFNCIDLCLSCIEEVPSAIALMMATPMKLLIKEDLDLTTFIFLLLSGSIREIGVNQLYPDDIIRLCKEREKF